MLVPATYHDNRESYWEQLQKTESENDNTIDDDTPVDPETENKSAEPSSSEGSES